METVPKSIRSFALSDIFEAGFVGLLVGYILALWLSQWVWLEMRVNIGALIPASVLSFALLSFRKQIRLSYMFALILELILVTTISVIYGIRTDVMSFVPACLFREGCGIGSVGIDAINFLIGFVFIAGNTTWLFATQPHKS